MSPKKVLITSLVILMLAVPLVAHADDDPLVTVSTSVSCNQVDFSIDIQGGTGTYNVDVAYGDGQSESFFGIPPIFPFTYSYDLVGDSYDWVVNVTAVGDDFEYEQAGTVQIGPVVELTSVPFPPLVTLMGGEASITFAAGVSGGLPPYSPFSWDLNGDGVALSENEVSYTYTEGGGYTARVSATDSCPIEGVAELTVFVIDPDKDPETACHPTALKIANAVSELAALTQLARAEQLYSCEDILNIFTTGTDTYDGHVGFGRLWHAYQLTEVIPLLTWEEIRDWQLDGGFGWGSLLQLNRFADALGEDIVIRDLVGRVLTGENNIKDIRTGVRSVTRYEADFEDVLTRLTAGANSGELNQLYRLAQELGVDAAELDGYLDNEMSLAELRQASKLAERMGVELTEVTSVGVTEFRSLQREIERTERETARDERTAERIAERLAEQFEGAVTADVMSYFEECEGKWGCVRKKMRENEQSETQAEGYSDQDLRKAEQIASKYDVSLGEVKAQYGACDGNWGCVQAHFRDVTRDARDKKKDK